MGRATRWFRGLFGLKSTEQTKKKNCSTKFQKEKDQPKSQQTVVPRAGDDEDARKRAIAVAAATAAVAEAAVAAAQAAAAVVQLTTSGRGNFTVGSCGASSGPVGAGRRGRRYWSREEWAAVTIQKHFRGYLARKALRALRGLVKLQALVRGYLVRKQTTYALRRLQALVRAQVRARVGRTVTADSSMKTCYYNHLGPATPEKPERVTRAKSLKHSQHMVLKKTGSESTESETHDVEKSNANSVQMVDNQRSGSRTRTHLTDDERSDKILEVDTGNQNTTSRSRRLFHSSSYHSLGSDRNYQSFSTSKDTTARQSVMSPSSGEVQSLSYMEVSQYVDDNVVEYLSPTFYPASSRGRSSRSDAFTPTKSDGTRSCLSNYVDHPNYMVPTESAKAKVRSLSAPKLRPPFERSISTKRYSIHGYGYSRPTHRVVASLANRAYPGSGYLDKLGMPIRSDATAFSSQLCGY